MALEEDYIGKVRLMEILNLLYNLPVDKGDYEKALKQRAFINQKMERTAELKNILPQLEAIYEVRMKGEEGKRIRSHPLR